MNHGGGHFLRRSVARKLICGGEKKSFEAFRVGSDVADQRRILRDDQKFCAGAEFLTLEFGGDVEHRPAFGHNDDMHVNVAARYLIEDLAGSLRALKKIFSSLKTATAVAFADEIKRE